MIRLLPAALLLTVTASAQVPAASDISLSSAQDGAARPVAEGLAVSHISDGQAHLGARPPADNGAPSATTALLVSAGATAGLAGLGALAGGDDGERAAWLIGAAVVVGPSAGNVWLGEPGDAAVGLALRVAGVGAALYAIDGAVTGRGSWTGTPIFILGAATALAGFGYELRTQHINGRAANVRVRQQGAGLAITARL